MLEASTHVATGARGILSAATMYLYTLHCAPCPRQTDSCSRTRTRPSCGVEGTSESAQTLGLETDGIDPSLGIYEIFGTFTNTYNSMSAATSDIFTVAPN